jgi:hypothetical protein
MKMASRRSLLQGAAAAGLILPNRGRSATHRFDKYSGRFPMESVQGAAWSACYSTQAVTFRWLSGSLFDVITAGPTTTTIKATNGFADITTLASLMGISPTTGIGGLRCSKWYDQSGRGNDATQATTGLQPTVWLINGLVFMAFDGCFQDFVDFPKNNDQYFNIPTSVTFTNQNMSMFAVVQHGNSIAGAGSELDNFQSTIASTSSTGNNSITLWVANAKRFMPFVQIAAFDTAGGFVNKLSGLLAETNKTVLGMICDSRATTFTQNQESGFTTAVASNTVTGGQIGAYPFDGLRAGFYGRMQALMLAGSTALTSTQQTTLRKSLYDAFDIVSEPTVSVLLDGASIDCAEGGLIGGVSGYGWMEQLLPQLSTPLRVVNTSFPGAEIEQQSSFWSTLQRDAYSASYPRNVLFAAGTGCAGNSINFVPDNPAQAYTAMQAYVKTATAAGSWTDIFVCTLIGEANAPSWLTYNNLLRANPPASTRLIDIAGANPILGGYITNPTYSNSADYPGWGHPTTAFYALMAAPIKAALNAAGIK